MGSYDGEDIIFVKYGCAFTKTSIYSSITHELISNYGDKIDLYEISDQAIVYLYSEAESAMVRVDPKLKGWVKENEKWYYLYSNINMAFNTNISGYRLGADGSWIH